jgi:CBS domain-containing protein
MRLTVADLMTQCPVTVSPELSADGAVQILSRHEASELYVIDPEGRLLGVVPDYELLKAELSGEAIDANVGQLMSRNVPVFTPKSDAAEVARLFRDGRYGRFPVVSAGKLVGVITRGDVVRLMAVLRRIDSPATTRMSPVVRAPKLVTAKKTGKRAIPAAAPRARASRTATRSGRRTI